MFATTTAMDDLQDHDSGVVEEEGQAAATTTNLSSIDIGNATAAPTAHDFPGPPMSDKRGSKEVMTGKHIIT